MIISKKTNQLILVALMLDFNRVNHGEQRRIIFSNDPLDNEKIPKFTYILTNHERQVQWFRQSITTRTSSICIHIFMSSYALVFLRRPSSFVSNMLWPWGSCHFEMMKVKWSRTS